MIIVLYDGQCMFCEGWVRLVIRHTNAKNIKFLPIQFSGIELSDLLLNSEVPSMVVIESGKNETYFDARASIVVMKTLGWGMNVLAHILSLIPTFVVDYFYRVIGRNRYLIFGRSDICELPTNVDKSFFVSNSEEAQTLFYNESVDVSELNDMIKLKYIDIVGRG